MVGNNKSKLQKDWGSSGSFRSPGQYCISGLILMTLLL